MATESSREARRRKILDRGTDRMAFITGQARSLPPSAVTTDPPVASSPLSQEGGEVEEPVSATAGPACDNITTGYGLPKCEPISAAVRNAIDASSSVETFVEREKRNEAVGSVQHNNEPTTSHVSYDEVAHTEPLRVGRHAYEMFTAKRISSSISACENIRMLCAAFIALLVVLSYNGYPVGGEVVSSIISFKPIYLVLLTDASVVLGVLFTTNLEEKDEADAGRTGQESKDWTDQMGQALEIVFASQKVASAVFLDCCLCAVIIICGTSFGTTP